MNNLFKKYILLPLIFILTTNLLLAQNVLVVQNQDVEENEELNESPSSEIQSYDTDDNSSSNEVIYYNLPDFEVKTEKDRSYYSAHTLSATRTNALIKETPATITVINKELIEDLNIASIGDIDQVIASAVKEEDPTSDNALRFRGFQTTFQLFEFMPRLSPISFYNVERTDVIRGANSLIFGQSAPGGKVNLNAKKPRFNKNSERLGLLFGNKGREEYSYDINTVINNQFATRLMSSSTKREYQQLHKYSEFKGSTLELLFRPTSKTQYRLHLERISSDRGFTSGTYKDRTGESGVTGIPEDFPATSNVADYMSDGLLNYIINYNDQTLIDAGTRTYFSRNDGSLPITNSYAYPSPYININSEQDLRDFYSEIGPENSGNAAGATISKEKGNFIFGDITHRFSEKMEGKISVLHEKTKRDQMRPEGGNNLLASTTQNWDHIAPTEAFEIGGENAEYKDHLYVQSYWVNSLDNNESNAIRTTLFTDIDLFGTKQRLLIGYDYDYIKKRNDTFQLFNPPIREDSAEASWALRTTDSFNLPYYGGNSFDYVSSLNGINAYHKDGANSYFLNQDLSNYDSTLSLLPEGYDPFNQGSFYPRSSRFGNTELNAVWFALQGKYLNNKLSTLLGARYDDMYVQSTHLGYLNSENQTASSEPKKNKYQKLSPSLGAIYWVNSNVGIFANHSASIQTPTSNELQADGSPIPPQTGKGSEIGFKFDLFDGTINGQIMGFDVEKKNDSTQFENPVLRAWAKINAPELFTTSYEITEEDDGSYTATRRSRFQRYGRHIADTIVNSRGIELDLYYNPGPTTTLFLGYAYLDTEITNSPVVSENTSIGIKDGFTNPGTSHHKAVLNYRKNFNEGPLKGFYIGAAPRYYSESYAGNYYEDVGHQGDELWKNKVKDAELNPGYLGDGLADVTSVTEYDINELSDASTGENFADTQDISNTLFQADNFASALQQLTYQILEDEFSNDSSQTYDAYIEANNRLAELGPVPKEQYDTNNNNILDSEEYVITPGAKTNQPKSHELWLSDHLSTSIFVGWRGKINRLKNAPIANIHLQVDNAFNEIDLLARGINAYYTDSRSYSFRFTLDY